ncbi:MAG: hypothetical protein JJU29_18340 [Verrucomicrobia bacterium]|nr:hypothetical protein [Verrucomicrobiota bacterium]MCH8512887.1 hypothetical protein [Kiritimatiellia bacterium]
MFQKLFFLTLSLLAVGYGDGPLSVPVLEQFVFGDADAAVDSLESQSNHAFFLRIVDAQRRGDLDRADRLLRAWEQAQASSDEDLRFLLLHKRQQLMRFEADSEESWQWLSEQFPLPPSPGLLEPRDDLPNQLEAADWTRASWVAWSRETETGFPGLVREEFAHRFLDEARGPAERSALLAKMRYPVHPLLVMTLLEDLQRNPGPSFGDLEIHRNLTLSQLEELAERRPALLANPAYLKERFRRLSFPADSEASPQSLLAHLEKAWPFVQSLPDNAPDIQRAFLLHLLDLQWQSEGKVSEALLLRFLQKSGRGLELAANDFHRMGEQGWLSELWPAAARLPSPMPPHELLREILLNHLHTLPFPIAFEPYIEAETLRSLFAESKLLHGEGDPGVWRADFTDAAYRELFERMELRFPAHRKVVFPEDGPVTVLLDVKRIDEVQIQIYELNALNLHRRFPEGWDVNLPLGGMHPAHTRTLETAAGPFRRVRHEIPLPEIRSNGYYVVEFHGGELSARALLQIGTLTPQYVPTREGILLRVMDGEGAWVRDASVWVEERSYAANDRGEILLPFFEEDHQRVLLSDGELVQAVRLSQSRADLALDFSLAFGPQNLKPQSDGELGLQLFLTLNGQPLPVSSLENAELYFRMSFSAENEVHKRYPLDLSGDPALIRKEMHFPKNLTALDVMVEGNFVMPDGERRQIASKVKNQILFWEKENQFLLVDDDGWLLASDPEAYFPRGQELLELSVSHQAFRGERRVTLKRSAGEPIYLGVLPEVLRIETDRVVFPLQSAAVFLPNTLRLQPEKAYRLPYPRPILGDWPKAVLLKLTEDDVPLADHSGKLSFHEGALNISPLPAGRYGLLIEAGEPTPIILQVREEARNVRAVFPDRDGFRDAVPEPDAPPILREVEETEQAWVLHLENAGPSTQLAVHVSPVFSWADNFRERLFSGAGEGTFTPNPLSRPDNRFADGVFSGDEERYVRKRPQMSEFAGSLLPRPGLQLNPWELRETTVDEEEEIRKKEAFREDSSMLSEMEIQLEQMEAELARGHAMLSRLRGMLHAGREDMMLFEDRIPWLPQVLQPDFWLTDLRIDADGRVLIPKERLEGYAYLNMYLGDGPYRMRQLIPISRRHPDLISSRFEETLEAGKYHRKEMVVKELAAGDPFRVPAEPYRMIDDFAGAWEAFSSLASSDEDQAAFRDFSFLPFWSQYDEETKRKWFEDRSSHEFHLFLHARDPEFFARVVRPHLQHKSPKTLIDRWLLDELTPEDRDPARFRGRNVLELALLAKRGIEREAILSLLDAMGDLDEEGAHPQAHSLRNLLHARFLKAQKQTPPEFFGLRPVQDPRHPFGHPRIVFYQPPSRESAYGLSRENMTPEELAEHNRKASLQVTLETRQHELIRMRNEQARMQEFEGPSSETFRSGFRVSREILPPPSRFGAPAVPRAEKAYFQYPASRHSHLPSLREMELGAASRVNPRVRSRRGQDTLEALLQETVLTDLVLHEAGLVEVLAGIQGFLDVHPSPRVREIQLEPEAATRLLPNKSFDFRGQSVLSAFFTLSDAWGLEMDIRNADGERIDVQRDPLSALGQIREYPLPVRSLENASLEELLPLLNEALEQQSALPSPRRFFMETRDDSFGFEDLFGSPGGSSPNAKLTLHADRLTVGDLLREIQIQLGYYVHAPSGNRIPLRSSPPSVPRRSTYVYGNIKPPIPPPRLSPFWAEAAAGNGGLETLLAATPRFTEVVMALSWSALPFQSPEWEGFGDEAGAEIRADRPKLLLFERYHSLDEPETEGQALFFHETFTERTAEGTRRIQSQRNRIQIPAFTTLARSVRIQNMGEKDKWIQVEIRPPEGAVVQEVYEFQGDRGHLSRHEQIQFVRRFYFPEPGLYTGRATQYAVNGQTAGRGEEIFFEVTDPDPYRDMSRGMRLALTAETEEILGHLAESNLLEEDLMPFVRRLREREFFEEVEALMRRRHGHLDLLMPFAVFHRDAPRLQGMLSQSDFAEGLAPAFHSPLLGISNPSPHPSPWMEWGPLHAARAHGVEVMPPALELAYRRFLRESIWFHPLPPERRLQLAWFLAQQNRLSDALRLLGEIPEDALPSRMQQDYLRAWLATRMLDHDEALARSEGYLDHPEPAWQARFRALHEAVDRDPEAAPAPEREAPPALHLALEEGVLKASVMSLDAAVLRLYPIHVEMQFSQDPFEMARRPFPPLVRPIFERDLSFADVREKTIQLPEAFRHENLMVEIRAGDLEERVLYLQDALRIRLMRDHGQVQVSDAEEGRPLPATYVKVYASDARGTIRFWKDGYTDPRGRFDYLSRNDLPPEHAVRFSILILHPEKGARVLESLPPLR